MEDYKNQKKKSEITEDDFKIMEKEIEELLDGKIKEVDKQVDIKEKELLSL